MDKVFALYGCGKAGLSVSLALRNHGYRIVGCDSRSKESRELGSRWLSCPIIKIPEELPENVPLMIGVSENAIPEVDFQIGKSDFVSGRVVFHLSGVLPSRALNRCRLSGAKVGSFHPLMILPDPLTGARNLRNATFAIEGRQLALDVLKEMAISISGKYFTIPVKGKTIYHIAAVNAANNLVALLAESMYLLQYAGVNQYDSLKAFQSLVEITVKNFYSEGPIQVLTGPVERGDIEMVQKHLYSLSKLPKSKEIYRVLGLKALEIARKKHPDRTKIYDDIEKILK